MFIWWGLPSLFVFCVALGAVMELELAWREGNGKNVPMRVLFSWRAMVGSEGSYLT